MIDGIPLGVYGPWGLVSVFFMLVFLGRLVPWWMHKERLKDRDDQIVYYKATLAKRDEQFDKLLSQGELNTRLLEDLKREAASKSGAGSEHR